MLYTNEQREQISVAAKTKIERQGISQNQLAKSAGINASYISTILKAPNGLFGTSGKPVPYNIFRDLARALGMDLDVVQTTPYMQVMSHLTLAKETAQCSIIEGASGTGKTFAIAQYVRTRPRATYVVTCAGDHTAKQFMIEVCKAMRIGLGEKPSRHDMRVQVAQKLAKEPSSVLIIDEAENLKQPVYESIKAIYDSIEGKSAIVLVGASGYFDWLDKRAGNTKGNTCFPQIFRRFRTEPLLLNEMSQSEAAEILNHYGVEDKAERSKLVNKAAGCYADLFKMLQKARQAQTVMAKAANSAEGKEGKHAA